MKAVFRKRLEKLALHLEKGKLGHERFDFNTVHKNHSHKKGFCGTAGCAMGECPVVFPRHWEFLEYDVAIKGQPHSGFYSGAKFFGLSAEEHNHLFMPGYQNVESYGGRYLGVRAKRESVASNIRAFLKKKKVKS